MGAITVRSAALATGTTVPYAETGDAAAPPVVLVHAYVESWRYFEPVLRRLPATLHAYAPTQRGHGGVPAPGGLAPEDFAADLVAFLDALGLERAALVGASSGGLVCALLAATRPDRVTALVLLSSPASLADKPTARTMSEALQALRGPLDRGFVEGFVRDTSPASLPDDVVARLVDETLQVPAHVWREALRGLLAADVTALLPRIEAPTLLVAGEDDALVGPDQQVLLRTVPRARLLRYPGVGHGVHLALPDRVVDDVAGFLAAVAPGR
ncbi:alpha/beta fold hydrolase [Puerhibacterium sp. TATVAM-FAB25]|uniref:alpha/beta fold hydrolase n=1 Tax=Puerhibacterium sp. TATVAM-FAB25 TaxID=3093699 RepID=UPI00397AB4A3